MDGEELYDEAQAGITENTAKPMVILDTTPKNGTNVKLTAAPESKGVSVKERLAMLQARNTDSKPIKPYVAKKPTNLNNNNTVSPEAKRPTKSTPVVSPSAAISAAIAKRSPTTFNTNEIQSTRKTLKAIRKPEGKTGNDEVKEVQDESEIVLTKDKRKFRKLPLPKRPGKPTKPVSLNNASLPTVQFTDAQTGVEQRICTGRIDSDSFKIQSMTEEDEMNESSAPALPSSSHPTIAPAKRILPPPPSVPVADHSIEELYGEAEADDDSGPPEGGQELYEEFDEVRPEPPARKPAAAPAQPPPPVTASPEAATKLSKAEKEKERKEKLKQEKIAKEKEKQRMKETKDRDAFLKKYKISEDEVVTSHYIQAQSAVSGGKSMLPVKAKDKLQLIRKTGCPDGKWIARNPYTDAVGFVEASNMIDLEAPANAIDEEIYEELN